MNKLYNISIILIFLIILSCTQTALSQDRLAVVSAFSGEVRIQHEGSWGTVTQVGNRIRNSSVYNGDTVLTMPGANVDLVFTDNSHLKVEEDTTLTISTRQITAEDRAKEGFVRNVSGIRQEVVRNINVKAGKLWADITPSKSVLTEFESPTGVASVRGTTLIFSFLSSITGIDLIQGLLDFLGAMNNLVIDFNSGDALNISEPEPGKTKIDVASGDIILNTSGGRVTVGDGATLNVDVNPDTGEITVVSSEGNVTITTPDGTTTPVGAGDNLGTTGGNGNDGNDNDDNDDNKGNDPDNDGNDNDGNGNNGDGGDNTDPFFGTSQSQSNQTQQESSDSNNKPITDPTPDPTSEPPASQSFEGPSPLSLSAGQQFTDDFSTGLGNWEVQNGYVDTSFGPNIKAKDDDSDNQFAVIHAGSDGKLSKTFDFQESGNRNIKFDFNFVSTMEDPILTFDDTGTAGNTAIPDGYGGLNWSNMRHLNGSSYPNSGYDNGTVSGTEVAYNAFANDGTISKTSGTFDVAGTYLSAAWRDGLQVTFTGSNNGTQLFNTTVTVDHTGPNWQDLDFTDIDTLKISTTGGEEVPDLSGSGAHVALDNFAVSDGPRIHLNKSDGTTVAFFPSPEPDLTAVSGLPTSKIDSSNGYQTGWLSIDWTGYVPAGLTTLEFYLFNDGDTEKEGALLIDNVVDPLVDIVDEAPAMSTDYLLSFARMLRDDEDMDSDDFEDMDSIESDSISEGETDGNNEVSLDAIRESLVVVKNFMENHVNNFGNTFNHDEVKAQLDILLAKVDATINNGGVISSSLKNEIETVLYGIIASHQAHCQNEGENCEYAHLISHN